MLLWKSLEQSIAHTANRVVGPRGGGTHRRKAQREKKTRHCFCSQRTKRIRACHRGGCCSGKWARRTGSSSSSMRQSSARRYGGGRHEVEGQFVIAPYTQFSLFFSQGLLKIFMLTYLLHHLFFPNDMARTCKIIFLSLDRTSPLSR